MSEVARLVKIFLVSGSTFISRREKGSDIPGSGFAEKHPRQAARGTEGPGPWQTTLRGLAQSRQNGQHRESRARVLVFLHPTTATPNARSANSCRTV